MKKILGISVAGLLAYFAISFLLAHLIVPPGTRQWVLIGVLWLLGLLAAAAVVWFLAGKNKQKGGAADAADTGAETGEVDALVKRPRRNFPLLAPGISETFRRSS